MSDDDLKSPYNWNRDRLSRFMHLAVQNIFATFQNKTKEYQMLVNIDDCYRKIIDHLLNTPDLLEALFLLRTHSAYYAACRLSMSGQIPETFVILRSCIENALYALHIKKNLAVGDIWLNRHDNEDSLKATRTEFTYRNIIKTLEMTDRSLHSTTKLLYERAIDFGAHPNERALSSALKVEESDDRTEMKQLYLTADDMEYTRGLGTTAQVGLCALYIFRHIFKERFDIMGITPVMDRYRSKL